MSRIRVSSEEKKLYAEISRLSLSNESVRETLIERIREQKKGHFKTEPAAAIERVTKIVDDPVLYARVSVDLYHTRFFWVTEAFSRLGHPRGWSSLGARRKERHRRTSSGQRRRRRADISRLSHNSPTTVEYLERRDEFSDRGCIFIRWHRWQHSQETVDLPGRDHEFTFYPWKRIQRVLWCLHRSRCLEEWPHRCFSGQSVLCVSTAVSPVAKRGGAQSSFPTGCGRGSSDEKTKISPSWPRWSPTIPGPVVTSTWAICSHHEAIFNMFQPFTVDHASSPIPDPGRG